MLNSLRKRLFLGILTALLVVGSIAVLVGALPRQMVDSPLVTMAIAEDKKDEINVPNVYGFGEYYGDSTRNDGIYIARPDEKSLTGVADRYYYGTASVDDLYQFLVDEYDKTDLNDVKYDAYKKENDVRMTVDRNIFDIKVATDKRSVNWYLRENAPAGIYCVTCTIPNPENEGLTDIVEEFNIVYTDKWTYLEVCDQDNNNYRTEFYGGYDDQLHLFVNFNNGATSLALNDEIPEGDFGKITPAEIVSVWSLSASVQSVNGEPYLGKVTSRPAGVNTNEMIIQFDDGLADDIYVVKVFSTIDGRIYGEYIIDNLGGTRSVNKSPIWVILMVAGGVLVLLATTGFFAPFIVSKINESRVYRENTRVAQMKNPDAFAQNKGSLFARLKNKFSRKKAEKIPEEEKPQLEDSDNSQAKKFTEMIREKREQRDYMQKYGVSSEQVEQIKKQAENDQNVVKQSFAFLRDDDDEIATFNQEKDEVSTIESGSYVQDGVTFASLDSIKDDNDDSDNQ